MASVETHFEKQGSLPTPGWLGRTIRLIIGVFSLQVFLSLALARDWILANGYPVHKPSALIGLVVGFYLLPYVINIGWTLNWKRIPQWVIVFVSLALGGFYWFSGNTVSGPLLNGFTLVWLLYVFSHLGIAFVISATIATPGCEMRAIPHLISKVTGRPTREHCCPGPLHQLDQWERRKNGS